MLELKNYQMVTLNKMVSSYEASVREDARGAFSRVNFPTGFGKTVITMFLFLQLRKRDPQLKMIISTPQHKLVQNILQSFISNGLGNYRILNIKGVEEQVSDILKDKRRKNRGVKESMNLIEKFYPGNSNEEAVRKASEFRMHMDNACMTKSTIDRMNAEDDDEESRNPRLKMELDNMRAAVSDDYKSAIRILNDSLKNEAKVTGSGSEKREKKEIIERRRLENLETLDNDILWLFPELQYDIADIIMLTHAKLNTSILSHRRLSLQDIDYETAGRHIVLVIDECEDARSNYMDNAVDNAMRSKIDMLKFLNMMYSTLIQGYFDNADYIDTGRDDERAYAVQAMAGKLLEECDEFAEKYGYEFNMHMADMTEKTGIPKMVTSGSYSVTNGYRGYGINTVHDDQTVHFLKEEKSAEKNGKDDLDTEEDETYFMQFIWGIRSLSEKYIGLIRSAAYILNKKRNSDEDVMDTVRSVASRMLGNRSSTEVNYVVTNCYLRNGARYSMEKKTHPYRSGISYMSPKPGTVSGRDVVLNYINIPDYPEAGMENIMNNIQYTYLISGTGWLPAMNNYNFDYLGETCSPYEIDGETMEKIHDLYMEEKKTEYTGVSIVTECITGDKKAIPHTNSSLADKHVKDADCIARFIAGHMKTMKSRKITGGCGALIFPPRKIQSEDAEGSYFKMSYIYACLRRYGIPMNKVVMLTMAKGRIYTVNEMGKKTELEGCYDAGDPDTITIDTKNDKFYYLITAMRSGSRGYNIAFKNRGVKHDASGILLFALSNIIAQRKKDEDLEKMRQEERERYEIERNLAISAQTIHSIILTEGCLDKEIMNEKKGQINRIINAGVCSKDIYRGDINSPYKLQAASEILQALGRIRNKNKTPALYIGIEDEIITKRMLHPDQLDDRYLSYEASAVKRDLEKIIMEMEGQEAGNSLIKINRSGYEGIVKEILPNTKRTAETDPCAVQKLKTVIDACENYKRSAISLGREGTMSQNLWVYSVNGIKLKPFTCMSYRRGQDTYIRIGGKPDSSAVTPQELDIAKVFRMFGWYCEEELHRLMPLLSGADTIRKMEETHMFPYAPNKDCLDILAGELGEKLFTAVITEACRKNEIGFTIGKMPDRQYEDFDMTLQRDGDTIGYINIKYRRTDSFNLEKDLKYYEEKVLRSPLAGTVPLIYINMRPSDKKETGCYTEESDIYIKKINERLAAHGKKIEIYTIVPFEKGSDRKQFLLDVRNSLLRPLSAIAGRAGRERGYLWIE